MSDRKGRSNYHHGNLREALLAAALKLIADKGPAGFTFAEAARAAGVSPAAPYRHFRDRDALMADLAERGFRQLSLDLEKAWSGGKPDVRAAFFDVGRSYLSFAKREPALFAAMFESGAAFDAYPGVRAESDRAFGVLRDVCGALAERAAGAQKPPALMMALHIWSLTHGIAALFGRGDDSRRPIPMTADELLEAACLIYLDGLEIS